MSTLAGERDRQFRIANSGSLIRCLARDLVGLAQDCRLRRRGVSGFFLPQLFEGAMDEPADVPGVDVFVRELAGGVVAAGQHAGSEAHAVLAEGVDGLERVLARKSEIVVGVDHEAVFAGGVAIRTEKPVDVADRADGGPESAEALLGEARLLKTLADMARALAFPDHVSEA